LFLKEYDDECPNGPHHRAELEEGIREYNGSEAVRSLIDVRPSGANTHHWQRLAGAVIIMICASEDQKSEWAVESHAWKCNLPLRY